MKSRAQILVDMSDCLHPRSIPIVFLTFSQHVYGCGSTGGTLLGYTTKGMYNGLIVYIHITS